MAEVTAVAQIWSLAQECSYVMSAAKKEKKERKEMPKKDKMPNGYGILKKSCNTVAIFAYLMYELAGQ